MGFWLARDDVGEYNKETAVYFFTEEPFKEGSVGGCQRAENQKGLFYAPNQTIAAGRYVGNKEPQFDFLLPGQKVELK